MTDTFFSWLRSLSRALLITLAIVASCVALFGWYFLLRSHVASIGGPRLYDVLPLDELPKHDSVPLLIYLPIAILISLGLALVARFVGMNRLLSALTLASGVAAILYVFDVASIYSVRQVSLNASLRVALDFRSIYVFAGIAGLGGALVGRHTRRGEWVSSFIVFFVTVAGILDLASAIVPQATAPIGFSKIGPGTLPPIAEAVLIPAGALLVMCARGLSRHNRGAWQVALVASGITAVLNIIRGLDYANASLAIFNFLCLFAARSDFTSANDPKARRPAIGRLIAVVTFAYGYALIIDIANRAGSNVQVHFNRAAVTAAKALIGIGSPGGSHIGQHFSEWYSPSVAAIVAIGVAWSIATWIGPWRHRPSDTDDEKQVASEVVKRWGNDTLSPFALRDDKALFFYPDPATVLANDRADSVVIPYRVIRGIAILTGDPIGPADTIGDALTTFLARAKSRGWRVAVVGASGRNIALYRERGMRMLYHGDEALLGIDSFNLKGPPQRVIRQAVHRVDRKGYHCTVVRSRDVTPELQGELQAVESQWLAGKPRRGFVMQLDSLFHDRDDVLFFVARNEEGQIDGFLHMCLCEASGLLSLSSMPRRDDGPNGLNAWLITKAVEWAKERGFGAISMNFAPFAKLLDASTPVTGYRRIARSVLLRLKGPLALQLDNLFKFNQRFSPKWESRYLVYQRRRDLPRVVIAALAAEGHLPFAARYRGWETVALPQAPDGNVTTARAH